MGEMSRKDKVLFTLGIIFITIIAGYFIWDWGIQEYIQFQRASDKFCQEKGYNKMTDYVNKHCRWGGEEYRMECDGEKIYPTVDINWCIKTNKWGDCKEEGYTIYDYKGNISC